MHFGLPGGPALPAVALVLWSRENTAGRVTPISVCSKARSAVAPRLGRSLVLTAVSFILFLHPLSPGSSWLCLDGIPTRSPPPPLHQQSFLLGRLRHPCRSSPREKQKTRTSLRWMGPESFVISALRRQRRRKICCATQCHPVTNKHQTRTGAVVRVLPPSLRTGVQSRKHTLAEGENGRTPTSFPLTITYPKSK